MSVNFSPFGNTQIVDENGAPAVGWKINTYTAGSSSPLTTYTSSDGITPQSNPIILNALGFPTLGQIWLTEGLMYKFQVTDENDVVKYTVDNVSGINDTASTTSQWIASGVIPTYISANSFSLIGDQTSAFQVYRRARFSTTAGTVYGNITASVFNGSITTVTMQMDSPSVLDTGLSAVDLSFMEANPLALPSGLNQSFAMVGASIIGAKGATIAGAATIDVFAATDGNVVDVSGSGWTCTSFGTAPQAGYIVEGTFIGTGTLTQSANLNLNNGGQNIPIEAGDKYRAIANTTTQIDVVVTKRASQSARGDIQLASSAEVAALIDLLKAITPGTLASAFLSTQSPTGVLVVPSTNGGSPSPVFFRWGVVPAASVGGSSFTTSTVNFASQFPNECWIVLPVALVSGGQVAISVDGAPSASSFQLVRRNLAAGAQNIGAMYLALGR